MRVVGLAAAIWALMASGAWAAADLGVDARRLQEDLVTQRAMAIAHERRLTSAGDDILLARLDVAEGTIRARLRDLGRTQAERDAARAELTPVIAERDRFKALYAQRDDAYAAEVAEYQRQIDSLLHTDDPKLAAALQRFADGDRVGAFPVIEAIMRAQIKAAEAAANEQAAAQLRQLAGLADDMRGRGEKTSLEVIALWEEAQRRTGTYQPGWLRLSELDADAGRTPASLEAARQAVATAASPHQKAMATTALGAGLLATGDLAGARDQFRQDLAIARRELAASPASLARRRDVAILQYRLGEVLAPLGDSAGARAALEESVAILRAIADSAPSDAAGQFELAGVIYQLGVTLNDDGETTAARAQLEAGVAIARRLIAEQPADGRYQLLLSACLSGVGDSLGAAGDFAGARDRFVEAAQVMLRLAQVDPSNVANQRNAALAVRKLAGLTAAMGDYARARPAFEQALALVSALHQADPGDVRNLQLMAEITLQLAQVAGDSGDPSNAVALSARAVQLRRDLAAADGADARARIDLGDALRQAGDLAAKARKTVAAVALYEEALDVQRKISGANPADSAMRLRLAQTLGSVADEQLADGDLPIARARYRESVAITRELFRSTPDNADTQRQLGFDLSSLGDISLSGADYADAAAAYREALPPLRRLAATAPAIAQPKLKATLQHLGDVLVLRGAMAEALPVYDEEVTVARAYALAHPASPSGVRSLAEATSRMGELLRQSDHLADARDALSATADLYRQLGARPTALPEDQRQLGATLNDLGDAEERLNDKTAAAEDYTEALALWRVFDAAHPDDLKSLRNLVVTATSLAVLKDDPALWAEALKALEVLDARGALSVDDKARMAVIRARVAPGAVH